MPFTLHAPTAAMKERPDESMPHAQVRFNLFVINDCAD
jgi:hypothetical protein